jgi:hypothetical protein
VPVDAVAAVAVASAGASCAAAVAELRVRRTGSTLSAAAVLISAVVAVTLFAVSNDRRWCVVRLARQRLLVADVPVTLCVVSCRRP